MWASDEGLCRPTDMAVSRGNPSKAEAAIKHKLIELGADVTYVDDRPSNNSFFTGIVRVCKKILDAPILKYYAQLTDDIADFPGL